MNSVWCDAGAPTQRSSCVAAWRRRLAAGLVAVASTFGSHTTSVAVTSPAPVHRYQYLGANPLTRGDPTGLTYDDSWVDDFEADYTGHRLYALGTINEGARWASLGLQTTLDIAGSLLGVDVFQSVADLAAGGGGFWEAMNILMSANPVGRLGANRREDIEGLWLHAARQAGGPGGGDGARAPVQARFLSGDEEADRRTQARY